jgi:8-oxo-dGTP pyrophosphatase MutT (NUDIX family)
MPELSFANIELSAGGVILRRRESGVVEVLLIEDSYGNWGFPKGHVEGVETSEQAALRECREETGLANLRTIAPIGTTDWYFRSGRGLVHKFCDYFLLQAQAEDEARPQRGEGIRACAWLSPDDALARVTYSNARAVLRSGLTVEGAPNAGPTRRSPSRIVGREPGDE